MGLSWNPCSWTPSNLAESLVEGLTGSEALGDLAGLAMASATGDVKGVASQSLDLADNVAKGAKKFADGLWNAATSAIKEFSNPGRVQQPSIPKCPGYSSPAPAQPGDLGTIGSSPSQVGTDKYKDTSKPKLTYNSGNIENDINGILNDPNLSLETKIMLVLMKMQEGKRKDMKESLLKSQQYRNEGAAARKQASEARMGSNGEMTQAQIDAEHKGDTAEANTQREQALMQQFANDLSQLANMTTNLQKLFHDMKMATIQNLR